MLIHICLCYCVTYLLLLHNIYICIYIYYIIGYFILNFFFRGHMKILFLMLENKIP